VRDKSEHKKEASKRGELTYWRAQWGEQVRTRKGSKLARDTHSLNGGDGETNQCTERKQVSDGHSQTGERRERGESGHQ
jgi:hypothetical protein